MGLDFLFKPTQKMQWISTKERSISSNKEQENYKISSGKKDKVREPAKLGLWVLFSNSSNNSNNNSKNDACFYIEKSYKL